jgi:GDP-L-fucose synthase
MKVFVTGGSGFLGKRLKLHRPDWTYLSSEDVDLTDYYDIEGFLLYHKPDAVVHLAARVGGIKDNAEHPADFFSKNAQMNTNIVDACFAAGVPRLLASLSTCAFPNVVEEYPFSEENLLDGPPAPTNLAYGYTKRLLWVHIKSMREQHGVNYSCFSPSNLYGPGDHFDLESSHFVAAAIRKLHECNKSAEFWGTGAPKRQQLYVDDLCRAIPSLLEKHDTVDPIIVAPDENLSISEMVSTIRSIIRPNADVIYNGKLDGQYRKDGSNRLFKALLPEFKFTSFEDGIQKTYEWYKESISNRN